MKYFTFFSAFCLLHWKRDTQHKRDLRFFFFFNLSTLLLLLLLDVDLIWLIYLFIIFFFGCCGLKIDFFTDQLTFCLRYHHQCHALLLNMYNKKCFLYLYTYMRNAIQFKRHFHPTSELIIEISWESEWKKRASIKISLDYPINI
jgi:hypothetical protein